MVDLPKVSEWNEALFKMARIHDSQNLINFYKRDLIKITDGKFNYENWFLELKNLRDEGDSKYEDNEKKIVNRIEKIIEELFKLFPAHIKFKNGYNNRTEYKFNKENFEKICKFIRIYEHEVKRLNDEHGLTTANKQQLGYFR